MPGFRHYYRTHAAPRQTFTPPQLGARYNFPPGDGSGQTVGIVELGGGFRQADLTAYFQALGLPAPSVVAVPVAGGGNAPDGNPDSADGEVLLDVEVAAAVAPKAAFRVYFAPNTAAGFLAACSQACRECDVVSISWGGPEDQTGPTQLRQMDAVFADAVSRGVTVFAAAGDNGSGDGEAGGDHVDFPASSPNVVACGGTRANADGSESVWGPPSAGNGATGGGFSVAFPRPAWQKGVPLTGRGVPDVAAVADPATGYVVRVDGSTTVIGGTSAVAPLWAGLAALVNQAVGKRVCLAGGTLYGLPAGTLRDITSGSNGDYSAAAGWDPCTGLGVPDGAKLLAALQAQAGGGGTPPPPPPPAGITLADVLAQTRAFYAALEAINGRQVDAILRKVEPLQEAWFKAHLGG